MTADLTLRIVDMHDDERFERDSQTLKRLTVVTYRLGMFGPFREEFDRDKFTETELRVRAEAKAAALRNIT